MDSFEKELMSGMVKQFSGGPLWDRGGETDACMRMGSIRVDPDG